MSVTSLSFTFVNMYAPPTAKPAAERQITPAQIETTRPAEDRRPGGGPNRLVQAMMSALRELGMGNPPAATPTAGSGATPPAASTAANNSPPLPVATPAEVTAISVATVGAAAESVVETTDGASGVQAAETLESAVHQFAHELFRALRQVGRGEGSEERPGRVEGQDHGGHRRHHGHHGHHGWRQQGYGDMSQRLQALSQTIASPAAAQAASAAAGQPAISSSISITLTIQSGPMPDTPVGGLTTAAATQATDVQAVGMGTESEVASETAQATSLAPSTPKNPLLDAFTKLFNILKPQGEAGGQTDIASKLRSFLETLSQAMRPQSMNSAPMPQLGGLMNITA